MNYKRNERYFTAAAMGKLATICWIAAVVGVVVVFLRISWITYLLGGSIALLAVIAGFVLTSYSVRDSEYDTLCRSFFTAFRKRYLEYVVGQMNKNNTRSKAPVTVDEDKVRFSQAFLYGQTMHRVGQDGKKRTGKYSMSAYLLDRQTLFIGYEMHNLLAEGQEELFGAYPLESIASISSAPVEDNALAGYRIITICLKTQPAPVSFPHANDAELDELITSVNNRIRQLDKQAEDA